MEAPASTSLVDAYRAATGAKANEADKLSAMADAAQTATEGAYELFGRSVCTKPGLRLTDPIIENNKAAAAFLLDVRSDQEKLPALQRVIEVLLVGSNI